MSYYKHNDKKTGDGLTLADWNNLSKAMAGNQGLTLATGADDKISIGLKTPKNKLDVEGGVAIGATYSGTDAAPENGLLVQGKVGIGTTDPKIHLAIGDNDTGLQQQGDGELAIYTHNAERVCIKSNGYVSIKKELDVDGYLYGGHIKSYGGLEVAKDLSVDGNIKASGTLSVDGTSNNYIQGNVGIGTTSPKSKLSINAGQNDGVKMLGFCEDDTEDNFYFEGNFNGYGEKGNWLTMKDWNNNKLMTWRGDGNVGIGTSSPSEKLHIKGSSTAKNPVLLIDPSEWDSSGDYGELRFGDSNHYVRAGHTQGMNIYDSDSITLESKNGDITLKGENYYFEGMENIGDYKNVQYNSSTGQLGYDNSSARYKENIRPLQDDFQKLLTIQPKTYTRPGKPDRWEIGFLAEDFDALGLKPLLFYDEEGLPESINYRKVCLYLLEIAKRHEQRIADTEKRTLD